jgi:hypothetical protein
MSIVKIKAKLKEDFSFIKNDGKVLDYLVKEILSENNNELQKTLDFIDTLCKKDVQNRITRIIKELETAGEISLVIKDEIKKDNDKLDKLNTQIDKLEDTISELEETKDELEETISELQVNFEKKQNEIKIELDKENENRTKELEKLNNARDILDTELIKIQSNIDNIFENSYENEFVYDECDYIIKEPMIHLDVEKALTKMHDINNYVYYNKQNEYVRLKKYKNETFYKNRNYYDLSDLGIVIYQIIFNFPINIKLNDNEIIIKTFIITKIANKRYIKYNLVYLTNYGRIINSNDIGIQTSFNGSHGNHNIYTNIEPTFTILENKYYKCYSIIEQLHSNSAPYVEKIIVINHDIPSSTILPKLLYRMPRLFLDVIDAFHTQNNDLMQECCKKYLSIARAKGTEKDIIDNIEYDRIIQTKDTIIIEKDLMIKTQNEIIEKQKEEIEKMKLEITKLKSALLVFTN